MEEDSRGLLRDQDGRVSLQYKAVEGAGMKKGEKITINYCQKRRKAMTQDIFLHGLGQKPESWRETIACLDRPGPAPARIWRALRTRAR